MLELQRSYARRLIGRQIEIACLNGGLVDGRLVSFNGHTLWVVSGDDDTFIALADVVGLAPRAA